MNQWRNKKTESLFNAFLQLKTTDEVANFCRDLMTEPEINEFAGRWEVAQELNSGRSQRETAKKTGVSIATITRVNQWLKRGMGGYQLVLDRLQKTTFNLSINHNHPHRG